jgi:hypothetical protein
VSCQLEGWEVGTRKEEVEEGAVFGAGPHSMKGCELPVWVGAIWRW